MKMNVKQFSNYLGVSYKTALKDYKYYLELAGKDTEKGFLTVTDICKIDNCKIEQVLEIIKLRRA